MSTILDALRKLQRERSAANPSRDLRGSVTDEIPQPQPRRSAPRRGLTLGALAALLVVLAGVGGAWLYQRGGFKRGAAAPAPVAAEPEVGAEPQVAAEPPGEGGDGGEAELDAFEREVAATPGQQAAPPGLAPAPVAASPPPPPPPPDVPVTATDEAAAERARLEEVRRAAAAAEEQRREDEADAATAASAVMPAAPVVAPPAPAPPPAATAAAAPPAAKAAARVAAVPKPTPKPKAKPAPPPDTDAPDDTLAPTAFPEVRVESIRWHPLAERRAASLRFAQQNVADAHEGDIIGGVLVFRIEPGAVELKVGSTSRVVRPGP